MHACNQHRGAKTNARLEKTTREPSLYDTTSTTGANRCVGPTILVGFRALYFFGLVRVALNWILAIARR